MSKNKNWPSKLKGRIETPNTWNRGDQLRQQINDNIMRDTATLDTPCESVVPFTLHSRGDNWFHFRKKFGSLIESFSITYCHDGSVCMTGDMGCLVWQRVYFPKKPDYGFPFEGTGIEYFAEKIVRVNDCQVIKDWDKELAEQEIHAAINERIVEGSNEADIKALEEVLDRMVYFETGEHGYFEMIVAFGETKHDIECEEWCEYGRKYSKLFEMRFEMLKSVSDQILDAIR